MRPLLLSQHLCLTLWARFYFPGILVGPYLDYAEYLDVINETAFQHAQVKAIIKPGKRLPPGRKRAAYTRMAQGLFYLGVFVLLAPKFHFRVALEEWFLQLPLWKRCVFPLFFAPFF